MTFRHPRCIALSLALLFVSASQGALAQATQPVDVSAYRGPLSSNTYKPLVESDDTHPPAIRVEPISDPTRREFDIPAFYARGLTVRGVPIIGSNKVSDFAFLECAYTLDHMLADSPSTVMSAIRKSKVKMGIISVVEYTMDIPENQTRHNLAPIAAAFQDRRSRGLGGLPLATCAEENLLNLASDPYRAENITIHEFSHTVANAVREVDPDWYKRLESTYQAAMKAGLFAHSYSATNEQEYWAEGVQAWFDCATPAKDATVHSGIWYRAQLKSYDPALAQLINEIFGDGPWRYIRTDGKPLRVEGQTLHRSADELSHLLGLNRAAMPAFNFENSPRIRALAESSKGNQK